MECGGLGGEGLECLSKLSGQCQHANLEGTPGEHTWSVTLKVCAL